MFFLNRKHSYSIDFVVLCVARKGVETMASKQKVTGNLAVSEQQRVIVIEATEKPQDLKLRVAAYTRVSSDSADQLNSFAAQNRYYTALISGKENWTMVDIYADRGITGTSAEKRADFQRLITAPQSLPQPPSGSQNCGQPWITNWSCGQSTRIPQSVW